MAASFLECDDGKMLNFRQLLLLLMQKFPLLTLVRLEIYYYMKKTTIPWKGTPRDSSFSKLSLCECDRQEIFRRAKFRL